MVYRIHFSAERLCLDLLSDVICRFAVSLLRNVRDAYTWEHNHPTHTVAFRVLKSDRLLPQEHTVNKPVYLLSM